jgi:hypothetical protein
VGGHEKDPASWLQHGSQGGCLITGDGVQGVRGIESVVHATCVIVIFIEFKYSLSIHAPFP